MEEVIYHKHRFKVSFQRVGIFLEDSRQIIFRSLQANSPKQKKIQLRLLIKNKLI